MQPTTSPATTEAEPAGGRNTRPAAGDQAAEALKDLRFELLRSALYHDLCQKRAGRIHRGLSFLGIILSSGAIAAFGAQYPQLGQLGGLAVACIAGAQLVWDFGGAAHCHGALRRRFYELLADLDEGGDKIAIEARQTRIFADEPPVDVAMNAIADKRAGTSIFGDKHRPL